jgi:hypothetical protein
MAMYGLLRSRHIDSETETERGYQRSAEDMECTRESLGEYPLTVVEVWIINVLQVESGWSSVAGQQLQQ